MQKRNAYEMAAFPFANNARNDYNWINKGMTLRDYFAAKAMQGWLSSYPDDVEASRAINGAPGVARLAYAIADAMMEARDES